MGNKLRNLANMSWFDKAVIFYLGSLNVIQAADNHYVAPQLKFWLSVFGAGLAGLYSFKTQNAQALKKTRPKNQPQEKKENEV